MPGAFCMTDPRLRQIAWLARIALALVFIWHGLVPKILWLSPDELVMIQVHNLPAPEWVARIAGLAEIILGLLLLWRRQRWPLLLAGLLVVDQGLATQSPAALQQSIGLFFVLVLALAIGTFTRFYLVSWIGERFVADIRKRVFNHLIELHPGFYESNRSSEIQSRLTADTTLLQSVIGSSLSMALRNLIMLVGGSVLHD